MSEQTTISLPPSSDANGTPGLCVVIVEAGNVASFPLSKQGKFVVGRAAGADIHLSDARVSREHALIHVGEDVLLEDLGSANGTLLRNRALVPHTPVSVATGEAIVVGNVVLMVQPMDLELVGRGSHFRPIADRSLASIIPSGAVVEDPRMKGVYELAARVAAGEVNVLILGESGSGKELLAKTIHRCSSRAAKPFLSLNCAALSEALLESELFGHERGAFTGALQTKAGLLESVPGGVLFLDEIGEVAPSLQAKLLRALETKEILRVGSSKPRPIDVRFVSATNRNLADEVKRGRFRRDLYFRLNTVTLHVPPLRERRAEIVPIARSFVQALYAEMGHQTPPALSGDAVAQLEAHTWEGNVRELRNAVHRALLLCGPTIQPEHLVLERAPSSSAPARLESKESMQPFQAEVAELERRRILEALDAHSWNQTRAAEHLGISRRTLLNRLDEYRVARPRKKTPIE